MKKHLSQSDRRLIHSSLSMCGREIKNELLVDYISEMGEDPCKSCLAIINGNMETEGGTPIPNKERIKGMTDKEKEAFAAGLLAGVAIPFKDPAGALNLVGKVDDPNSLTLLKYIKKNEEDIMHLTVKIMIGWDKK